MAKPGVAQEVSNSEILPRVSAELEHVTAFEKFGICVVRTATLWEAGQEVHVVREFSPVLWRGRILARQLNGTHGDFLYVVILLLN